MKQTLEQIVERALDPSVPVVWVGPNTGEDVWLRLPDELQKRGFRVYSLFDGEDYDSLMRAIASAVPMPQWARPNLNSLKDSLLSLEDNGERGWAMIFRKPEALRHGDEEAFEDFLEVLEFVNEIVCENRRLVFKLILPD